MRFGLDLRFDLKRLSEAQLGALLDDCWCRYEAAKSRAVHPLYYSARGPVRHRWAYAFSSLLRYGSAWPGPAVCVSVESLISRESQAVLHMHLALCDIADISDELQRRVARRGAVA
jgi:hypothetical protein